MRCPFCFAEKEPEAPVCQTCNRDTEIPASLLKEHQDLLQTRERLKAELSNKAKRLASLRKRTPR